MIQPGMMLSGFVSTPAQQLLDSAPVSFELGHQDSGVLLVPSVARQHPQLAKVVEGVLAERSHQLVGLAGAQLARSADKADRILGPSHGPPPRGADRLPRNVQELHRSEAGVSCTLDAIPIHIVADRSFLPDQTEFTTTGQQIPCL